MKTPEFVRVAMKENPPVSYDLTWRISRAPAFFCEFEKVVKVETLKKDGYTRSTS